MERKREATFFAGPSSRGLEQTNERPSMKVMGPQGMISSRGYSHEDNTGLDWAYKTFGKVYESCNKPAKRIRESMDKQWIFDEIAGQMEENGEVEFGDWYVSYSDEAEVYNVMNDYIGYYDEAESLEEVADIIFNEKNLDRTRESKCPDCDDEDCCPDGWTVEKDEDGGVWTAISEDEEIYEEFDSKDDAIDFANSMAKGL